MRHRKSEEWLALRGKMLTASDAATAIGVNKYETPDGLLIEEVWFRWEVHWERSYTRHGEKVWRWSTDPLWRATRRGRPWTWSLSPSRSIHWLGGSPDGVTESGKLVEIKCPPLRADCTWRSTHPLHASASTLYGDFRPRIEADFIQYKPAETNWPKPEEFDVVNVQEGSWMVEDLSPPWWGSFGIKFSILENT